MRQSYEQHQTQEALEQDGIRVRRLRPAGQPNAAEALETAETRPELAPLPLAVQGPGQSLVTPIQPGATTAAPPLVRPGRERRAGVAAERALIGDDSPARAFAVIFRHLDVLMANGWPMADALRHVSTCLTPEWRTVAGRVADGMANGTAASLAFEAWRKQLPVYVLPLLRAAERNGTTHRALRAIAAQCEREAEVEAKFAYSALNPGFVIPLGLMLGAALMAPFVGGAAGVGMMVAATVMSIVAWAMRRQIGLLLPKSLRSGANRNVRTASWSRVLATLYNGGIEVSEALDVAAEAAQNPHYAKALRHAAQEARRGVPLHRSLAEAQMLPPRLLDMMETGELTGDLGDTLLKFAELLDDDGKTVAAQGFIQQGVIPALYLFMFTVAVFPLLMIAKAALSPAEFNVLTAFLVTIAVVVGMLWRQVFGASCAADREAVALEKRKQGERA